MRYKGQNNQGGAKTGVSYVHMSTYAFSCVLLYENILGVMRAAIPLGCCVVGVAES